jgi:hypothetical protein
MSGLTTDITCCETQQHNRVKQIPFVERVLFLKRRRSGFYEAYSLRSVMLWLLAILPCCATQQHSTAKQIRFVERVLFLKRRTSNRNVLAVKQYSSSNTTMGEWGWGEGGRRMNRKKQGVRNRSRMRMRMNPLRWWMFLTMQNSPGWSGTPQWSEAEWGVQAEHGTGAE